MAFEQPSGKMSYSPAEFGKKLDWKQIELSSIERVGAMIKEDIVKWALSIDFLESIMCSISQKEDYLKELREKEEECKKERDDTERIKKLYKWKFNRLVGEMRNKEPLEIAGVL